MMSAFVMEAATVLLYPLSLYCKRRAVMPEQALCADADASSALLRFDIV
jgi:hypothetical protein